MITVNLFGKSYEVPSGSTIMEIMESVGLREKHDHGCHSGVCGACTVMYRMSEHGKKKACLACRTMAVDGMYVTAVSDTVVPTRSYRLDELQSDKATMQRVFPEIYACIGCGRCTAVCPKELQVKQYIVYAQRGDFEQCAQESFACVMCGACMSECPAKILHPQVALLARRLCGSDSIERCKRLNTQVSQVANGEYTTQMGQLLQTSDNEIQRLYATREMDIPTVDNVQGLPSLMTESEKQALLSAFHPDNQTKRFTALSVGANKGEKVPQELATLLQAHSRISPDTVDLTRPDFEPDVLVIGGGGAGCAAAIEAREHDAAVMLVTKFRLGDGNTVMAEGGIQAADMSDDSPMTHFLDSFGGGRFAAERTLLSTLVNDAPKTVQWLGKLGVAFDKDVDGEMLTTRGGGLSRKRMHAVKDHTGAEIMRVLLTEARGSGIRIAEHTAAVELVLDEYGNAAGAVLLDMKTRSYRLVKAKTVILATGGSGRLCCQGFPTTNYDGSTADGLVLGYRVGAKLRDADSLQYHPTGIAYPSSLFGLLVTEKARSLGARLLNRHGEEFVHPLESRDVVTAAIIRECTERQNGISTENGCGVWLDTPMIDRINGVGTIERYLPTTFALFSQHGMDIRQQPILVYPSLHYQNGGLEIRSDGSSTTVSNLFAVGEVAGGIHGKNRLMGNSLLDIVAFGRAAGKQAALTAHDTSIGMLTLKHLEHFERALQDGNINTKTVSPKLL